MRRRSASDDVRDKIAARRAIYEKLRSGRRYSAGEKDTFALGSSRRRAYDATQVPQDILVPEQLDLRKHRAETLELAEACRTAVFRFRTPIRLDFSQTKRISAPAALYLVAEIYRCRRASGNPKLLTGTYPADPGVHRQLQECGFFEILSVKHQLPPATKHFPLDYIKVVSGQGAVAIEVEKLCNDLFGIGNVEPDAFKAFYRSVSEAMTNVAQHADPVRPDSSGIRRMPQRWWMLGHVNKLRKEVVVMIVDQGIGIPRSLPKRYKMEAIKGALSQLGIVKSTDGEMIQAAMVIGRTSTERPHQGLGLTDLKRFIDVAGDGRLLILSNRGEYQYTHSKGETVSSYTDSVYGTLIAWTVPISAISSFALEGQNEAN